MGMMDLGAFYDVNAVQINFSEHHTGILGRKDGLFHQYTIEASKDDQKWYTIVDKSGNQTDNTHDYTQLKQGVSCRYLKIKNMRVPDGNFALSGFRVFEKGKGDKPAAVDQLEVTRNPGNRRSVFIRWSDSENATGYYICYGVDKNKLYHSYVVYHDTLIIINSLHADQSYFFTIESFNENGITKSGILQMIQ